MTRNTAMIVGGSIIAVVAAALAFAVFVLYAQPSPKELLTKVKEGAGPDGILVTFGGDDLKKWRLPAGHQIERFVLSQGEVRYVRYSSAVRLNNTTSVWADRGLSLVLPLEFAKRTAGHKIEIAVIARRPKSQSAPAISTVYATQQAGNSGWQKFKLSSSFATNVFVYDVPKPNGGYRFPPILVLNADPSGKGYAADLLAVSIRPLLLPR